MGGQENDELPPGVAGVDLPSGVKPARMTATTVTDQPAAMVGRDRYRVTVSFRHPVDAAGFHDGDLASVMAAGTSGLIVPAGRTSFVAEDPQVEGRELRIELIPNDEGRLASAVAELTVDSSHVARRIVTVHLGAVLARLAFETDALIAMRSVSVIRLSTGQEETGFLYSGPDVKLERWPDWQHHPNDYLRAAFCVYREGLNSINAYWAVLCFVRVIEGTRKYVAKLASTAKARGIDPRRGRVQLDEAPDIQGPFREWIGKSAGEISELLAPYRDPTAHGLDPNVPLQAADQIGVENRYWLLRPVAHQIARKVLRDASELRRRLGDAHEHELDDASFD